MPYFTLKRQVRLQPGQVLAFKPGKGYYAKGTAVDPMESELDRQVAAALRPERQNLAEQRNRTVELAKALAELQKDIAPATNAGYQDAAKTLGVLAGGYTGASRAAAEAEAAKQAEALRRLGAPEEQIANVVNTGKGAEDATYAAGAAIPGGALAQEGAAFSAAAARLPATALGRGQMAVMDLDRLERELEAKAPELRRQFRNELIEQKMKEEAQALYEQKFGLDVQKEINDVKHNRATEAAAARRARLAEKNYQLQVKKNQQSILEAEAEGRQPNASLSKTYGYIVDDNGQAILKNGKRIPVAKSSGARGSDGLTAGQRATLRAKAIDKARELRGEPRELDELTQQATGKKYIDRFGKPTNDKSKAQRDNEMTFSEAQAYIAESYGMSRPKARAVLLAAGWRPPKRKPRGGKR